MNNFIKSMLHEYLPVGTLESIAAEAYTLMRTGASYDRHPLTQAGTVLAEDGTFEARAGKGILASTLTLYPAGSAMVSAPGGLQIVGPLLLDESPSNALKFSYGTVQLNPLWEPLAPVFVTLAQANMSIMVLPPGAKEPVPVPLGQLISQEALFTAITYEAPSVEESIISALTP